MSRRLANKYLINQDYAMEYLGSRLASDVSGLINEMSTKWIVTGTPFDIFRLDGLGKDACMCCKIYDVSIAVDLRTSGARFYTFMDVDGVCHEIDSPSCAIAYILAVYW